MQGKIGNLDESDKTLKKMSLEWVTGYSVGHSQPRFTHCLCFTPLANVCLVAGRTTRLPAMVDIMSYKSNMLADDFCS